MGQKCSCFDKEMDSKTERNMKDISYSYAKEEQINQTNLKKVKEIHKETPNNQM